jgi:NACHT domain
MLITQEKIEMAAIPVHPEIFKLLKQAYSEKFGGSPRSLINRLNNAFKQEIDSESENLIAERTIRSFFNSLEPQKILEKNLNYFCQVLLDQPSYQEAVRKLTQTELVKDWLAPYRTHLARKCGTMRILDMNEPITINNIYVKFNILKNIQGRRQQTINLLLDGFDSIPEESQSYKRLSFSGNEKHIPALEAVMRYRKLMVLGKPGAGKTTFLKYLAMNFSTEEESADKIIPVFISLRDVYDAQNIQSLTNVVIKEFTNRIPNSEQQVRELLQDGQCFILLDGLDEVKLDKNKENVYDVYREIDDLVNQYPENRFIITCRTTASDYVFNDFTEVEIADFERAEIEAFARNWFRERGEADTCDVFLKKLENNEAVKELATNPLLLTILCLTFEDTYDFSLNRYAIYSDAVDTLLKKWDASRRIERQKSLNISRQRKINMLSQIAYHGLDHKPPKVLWHQWELLEQIADFMRNINTDIDTQQVLKLIESNYGLLIQQAKNIYSFSHLTFQEYFATEYVVENREKEFLNHFIEKKLTAKQWREVFILITERLSSADEFLKLMFKCVNNIIKDSLGLQNMLSWLDRMTTASGISTSAWRAYYLAIDLDVDLYISRDVEIERIIFAKFATDMRNFNKKRNQITSPQPRSLLISRLAAIHALAEDMSNDVTHEKYTSSFSEREFSSKMLKIGEDMQIDITEKLNDAIEKAKEINDTLLTEALVAFQQQCPSSKCSASNWGKWAEDLRQAMLKYLDVGYQVDLDAQDIKLLYDYIYANHLLLECISGENYCSKELREQIVDNMLLPTEKIPAPLL